MRTVRTVVLLSDSAICREALTSALGHLSWLSVVPAGSAAEAAERLRQATPDALLLQLGLVVGTAVGRMLLGLNTRLRIIALDTSEDQHELIAWRDAGIALCLPRGSSLDDVVRAIGTLCSTPGDGTGPDDVESATATAEWVPSDSFEGQETLSFCALGLTRRQSEVFALLQRGLSNKQIAQALSIETATVKNHVHSILKRLGLQSRLEVIAAAQQQSATARGLAYARSTALADSLSGLRAVAAR